MSKNGPKQPLRKEFREFSFPKETPAPPPALKMPELDEDDYFTGIVKRSHAAANNNERPPSRDSKWSLKFEAEQERMVEAARGLLPDVPEINKAIDESSDLDMVRIIAAGVLEQHFRGFVDDDAVVDSFSAAALLVDAENFEDISEMFDELTTSIVDEIRMAEDTDDDASFLLNIGSMEPETKAVFLALQVSELEKMKQDIRDGAHPPDAEEHATLGREIAAATTGGMGRSLLRRAVSVYNEVSVASDLTLTLKVSNDGEVELAPFPDVLAERPRKGPKYTPPKPKHPQP